jgi:hypothetical protein
MGYLPAAICFVLTLVIGGFAIDGRSLWTDEIGTWFLTQANDWPHWLERFLAHTNSDGQIPLYHATMHLWVQWFGDAEKALRAANLPWLLLALLGLSRMPVDNRLRWTTVAVFSGNALLWYQINDARPYVLHVAGACWTLTGCMRLLQAKPLDTEISRSWRELLFGSVLLLGGSVLGALWLFGVLVAFGVLYRARVLTLLRQALSSPASSLIGLFSVTLVLGVAVHSHLAGARASQAANFSLAGFAYGLMEITGSAGLGPSRHALRLGLAGSDQLQLALMLMLSAACASALLLAWLRCPERIFLSIAVFVPLGMLIGLGMLLHWRVIGRHASAVLPLLCLGLAWQLNHWWTTGGARGKAWTLILTAGLLASTTSIRLAERHEKDDYRQAAAWANDALQQGHRVLWLADERALAYYGLARLRPEGLAEFPPGLIPYTRYPEHATEPLPAVVVFSPREGVDVRGLARPVLSSGRYRIDATAVAFERHRLEYTNTSTSP